MLTVPSRFDASLFTMKFLVTHAKWRDLPHCCVLNSRLSCLADWVLVESASVSYSIVDSAAV